MFSLFFEYVVYFVKISLIAECPDAVPPKASFLVDELNIDHHNIGNITISRIRKKYEETVYCISHPFLLPDVYGSCVVFTISVCSNLSTFALGEYSLCIRL